jgi:hypothetical protein
VIWIQIIIAIIQAIPTIIDLIKKIIDLIHGHPLQLHFEMQLRGVLLDWHKHGDNAKAVANLHALHASIPPK